MTVVDQTQRDAALDLSTHVLAVAPAGSGKTGLLVRRALRALAACEQPEQVVCITFTRKAAAEIRHRVRQALELAQGAPPDEAWLLGLYADAAAVLARDKAQNWGLLGNPTRIRATTIDAFNQRLASQLPLLSGLGGSVKQLEQPQAHYQQAVLAAFGQLDERDLDDADRAALLNVLRWAGNKLDGLIPALSGLLASREQWLGRGGDADTVLRAQVAHHIARLDALISPDERAVIVPALQAASGLADAMAWAADLQAWPAATADAHAHWQGIATALSSQSGLRARVTKNEGFSDDNPHKPAFKALLADLRARPDAEALSQAVLQVRTLPGPDWPADYAQLRDDLARVLMLVYTELRVGFGQAGEADFPEVAQAAVSAASGQLGPEALRASDADIRHLLVDEMQDTSAAQCQLLEELTQNWQPGDGRSLFLVGDPQQSIYAFRNAQVRLFMHMMGTPPQHADARLGALPLTVVHLRSNFRSGRQLIDWFNSRFARIFPVQDDAWAGVVSAQACVAGPGAADGEAVRLLAVGADEAERAAAEVADLLARIGPGETIGILAASRTYLAPVLAALQARGVADVHALDVQALAQHPAVIDFVHLMRALRQPHDLLAWAVVLRAPWVGLAWADLLALSRGRTQQAWPQRFAAFEAGDVSLSDDGAARLRQVLAALTAAEAMRSDLVECAERVWWTLGAPHSLQPEAREAVRLAADCMRAQLAGGEIKDWADFERALDALYRPPGQGRVEVTTIHKSKGLEYDHVMVVGCGGKPYDGEAPMLYAQAQPAGVLLAPRPAYDDEPGSDIYALAKDLARAGQRNERLRLLYVAATRARQSLTLLGTARWSKKDDAYAPTKNSFMAALEADFAPALADLEPPDAEQDEDSAFAYPPQHRVPAAWAPPAADTTWLPSEQRARKPSEASLTPLGDDEAVSDLPADGDLYAQLVGTMVHLALERTAVDGLQAWADGGASRRPAMQNGLLRMGMPPQQVEQAVDRVIELVARTLASEAGQWVLRDWPWWRNEYPLSGWADGAWVSAVIDRCFEDDDGVLWVIDYKTAAYPINEPPDAYAQRLKAKYAEQMAEYVALLALLRPGVEVRGGLLLAETGVLVSY